MTVDYSKFILAQVIRCKGEAERAMGHNLPTEEERHYSIGALIRESVDYCFSVF